MQLRHGVQIKFLQIKNLTGGHLAEFWVHSTFRVQLIVLHAVTCNIFLNFILSYLQNQTDKTPQWKLPMARPNSIHLPPGSVHGSLLSHVDVPLSQAGKYSLFMLCCWPRFLRMTGSVPRKLLSVAEYSSLSAERQTRTLESNSAFQPPAAHNERSAVQRGEGKEKKKKEDVWDKSERNGRPKVEPSSRMQSWIGLWDPWCDFVNAKQMASARRAVFYFALPQYYHLLFRLLTETNKRRLSVELGFQMFDLWTPANSI